MDRCQWARKRRDHDPGGLQWQTADVIINSIASPEFDFIRLAYAIEMVDDIHLRNGSDVSLEAAMINAVRQENRTKVAKGIIAKNLVGFYHIEIRDLG